MITITKYNFVSSNNPCILFVLHMKIRMDYMLNLKIFTILLGTLIQSQNQQTMNR